MTEENKMLNEEMEVDIETADIAEDEKDPLKEALEEQFNKLRLQSMLLGAQTVSQVVLDKISQWERQPGKRTLNDHRRLIKELKQFCEVGVSRKINPDGTTSPIEEDNNADDNTKLMEETNGSNQ